MLLEAANISYAYLPGKTVLHDVSLQLNAGETLYVLGKNGCGKTTLLSCLGGLLKPNAGRVFLDSTLIADFSASERAKRIGLIPQMHTPAFAYTVRQMVMMGRAPHLPWLGSPTEKDHLIVEEALEQIGLLELQDRPYTEVSGGEQQLVLIARGLAQKCPILLMDEPTAHLDLSNQHRVMEIVHQLGQQGLSFIISSHEPNDALAYADNVLLLSGGWVTEVGKPQDVLTETLLSSVYDIQTEVIYQHENGAKKARAVLPRRPLVVKPDSLQAEGSFLNKIFKKRIEKPQIILVTGLSGSGKTSWCTQMIKEAVESGHSVEGILSPGIFEGNKKTGIEVIDLTSGERKRLARLREEGRGEISTPRWVFDPNVLDWANQRLQNSTGRDLLIIDELGPLEFLRNKGLLAGLERLDQGQFEVACVVVRSSLLPKALQRWPDAQVVRGQL
ncbi:MAG: ATP-binding cassette domain-containing protein [Brevefilum sp.]|nr:ATP-binding cassette domain-containing protein [Brevefilum sp.]MDT8381486.1 ATP-binding cassette domain-containing protein [Brevefilum sp.]MDW7755054.1 ATP-binding cassette domain-containing protein [Brevefilum sp.]